MGDEKQRDDDERFGCCTCTRVIIQSHTPDRLGKYSKRKKRMSRIGGRRSDVVGPSPKEKVDGIQESGTEPAAREECVFFAVRCCNAVNRQIGEFCRVSM